MRDSRRHWPLALAAMALFGVLAGVTLTGCAADGQFQFSGTPFPLTGESSGGISGPTSASRSPGQGSSSTANDFVDACEEPQARRSIRISMRNLSQDYIHYFMLMIAYVDEDGVGDGAVCPDDVARYRQFGYRQVPSGSGIEFGNYCIVGPALYYFHQSGQFRRAGTQGLGSAIGPARGTSATYDGYFGANGASIPVPDVIMFHNPGTGAEGAALKVSTSASFPCDDNVVEVGVDPDCRQDAFYYVDQQDVRAGSTVLGAGSYVRVPSDIQGTGCECLGAQAAASELAPSGTTAATADCYQFLRGGRIDYVFVRDDQDPPYPQLLWRVTDSSGARAHDFDARADIP